MRHVTLTGSQNRKYITGSEMRLLILRDDNEAESKPANEIAPGDLVVFFGRVVSVESEKQS